MGNERVQCIACEPRRPSPHIYTVTNGGLFLTLRRPVQKLRQLLSRFRPQDQPTEEEAKWFLRDRNYDVHEAYTKLNSCLRWRGESNMHKVTFAEVEQEAATGKAFLHNHTDIYGRPALVVRVARCASRDG
jgi:hypothetical protein